VLTLHVDDDLDMRLLEPPHAVALFELIERNRPHLRAWLPWLDGTRSARDTRRFIREAREGFKDLLMVQMGIWAGEELVGAIGINRMDIANRRAQIGYWLSRDHEGKGIVTRCCERLIRYGFEQLDLNKIEIRCEPGNERSAAIPERLGFVREGVLREAQWINGRFVDLVVYGMLAREWMARR
jgi:ribosomal-protein-serine acetyltransferase